MPRPLPPQLLNLIRYRRLRSGNELAQLRKIGFDQKWMKPQRIPQQCALGIHDDADRRRWQLS